MSACSIGGPTSANQAVSLKPFWQSILACDLPVRCFLKTNSGVTSGGEEKALMQAMNIQPDIIGSIEFTTIRKIRKFRFCVNTPNTALEP